MLARRLPDVLGCDLYPAVTLRRSDHRLEQPAVGLLDLALAGQLSLSIAQPHGKAVANTLELGDAQHTRSAHRGNAPLDPRTWKGRREELGEVLFEQGDLPPELLPRPPLNCGIGDPLERDAIETCGRVRGPDFLDLKQLLGQLAPPSAMDGRPQSSPGGGW
ncbi:MAG: hypothetical protein E6G49_01090 [Actinobacteria bacterium]|nr:MAG: hypothetical protein E6G49_01090 [Actinomycetota bacterium]